MHLSVLIGYLLLPVFISAWDIAVVTDTEIEFLQQGRLVGIASNHLKSLDSATYDPVKGDLFVSDDNHPNASIFRINMLSNTGTVGGFQPVVIRQVDIVRSIAFDVVTSTLFWSTGTSHTIHKLTNFTTDDNELKTGEILHKLPKQIPQGLAIDSCRQYLYWTNCKFGSQSIERSKIDGTDRKVIINDNLFLPLSISVDQQDKKLYWCDDRGGFSYEIGRSDLDGQNKEIFMRGTHHQPVAITVTTEKIYWSDLVSNILWSFSKDAVNSGNEPEVIKTFNVKNKPNAIISNIVYHKYQEKDCQPMVALKEQIDQNMPKWIVPTVKSVTSITGLSKFGNITIEENICLNNGSLLPNGRCDCMKGYSGARCDVSLCYNYCVSGTCVIDPFGVTPKCKCPLGRAGDRCEIDRCRDVCLNDGFCFVTASNEVSCKCADGYAGKLCETKLTLINELCRGYCLYYELSAILDTSSVPEDNADGDDRRDGTLSIAPIHNSVESYVSKTAVKSPPLRRCNCSEYSKNEVSFEGHVEQLKKLKDVMKIRRPVTEEFVSAGGNDGRANIIMTASLSVTSVVLLLAVIFLATRVCKLKKKPLIRKRIVVNRPPPLLTCRRQQHSAALSSPDPCEITIENCCNMNICDTPCFESEFHSSKPTFNKSKSEDKKGLLDNVASCSHEEMF